MRQALVSFVITIIMAASAMAQQGVPSLVNYQGLLTDAVGQPLATGTYDLAFSVYASPESVTPRWGPQTFNGVNVIDGRFNVILGPQDDTANPIEDAFTEEGAYLGITVGADPEISPRQQVLSAPYALVAGNAGSSGPDAINFQSTNVSFAYTGSTTTMGEFSIVSTGRPILVGWNGGYVGMDNQASTGYLRVERSINGGAFTQLLSLRFATTTYFDALEFPATPTHIDIPGAGTITYRLVLQDSSSGTSNGVYANSGVFYALEL